MNKRQKDARTLLESGINYFSRVHYSGKQSEYQACDINTDQDYASPSPEFATFVPDSHITSAESKSKHHQCDSSHWHPQALHPAPRSSFCCHMPSSSLTLGFQPTNHRHKTVAAACWVVSTPNRHSTSALVACLGTHSPMDTPNKEHWEGLGSLRVP